MRKIWNIYWDYTQLKSPWLQGFWKFYRHNIWLMPIAFGAGYLLRIWIPLT